MRSLIGLVWIALMVMLSEAPYTLYIVHIVPMLLFYHWIWSKLSIAFKKFKGEL